MYKLIVFDLDGTLAEIGKGITLENLQLLKQLETLGAKIAICSGKPAFYLCGLLRQLELAEPIIIGENGAVIQIGVNLPPSDYFVLPYSQEASLTLDKIRMDLTKALGKTVWYQPNSVAFTVFPKNAQQFELIQNYIDSNKKSFIDVTVYRHSDSFDFTPTGINKKIALEYLSNITKILQAETIAVGDGVNDYPMFEYAAYSIGVNVKEPNKVNVNFENLTEGLNYLIKLYREKKC